MSSNLHQQLRPSFPSTYFRAERRDLTFQIIDWKEGDMSFPKEEEGEGNGEEEGFHDRSRDEIGEDEDGAGGGGGRRKRREFVRETVFRGYGVTEEGFSICVNVYGFQPYFYIKLPESLCDKKSFDTFINVLRIQVGEEGSNGFIGAEMVRQKSFYGFANNELFWYGKLVFRNSNAYNQFKMKLKMETIFVNRLKTTVDLTHAICETKVSPILRFFHVQNLDPVGWIRIPFGKYRRNIGFDEEDKYNKYNKNSRCQIEISAQYHALTKVERNTIGRILIASYDIECVSQDGSFPKAVNSGDPVIQIGTTVYIYGERECALKYIATLGACDPIEGVIVEVFHSEKDLLLGWARFMAELDPDVVTGYNIWGFDWKYLYLRAETGNGGRVGPYHEKLYQILQRTRKAGKKAKLTEQRLSSSALGDNFFYFIDIEGVVQIDMLAVMKADVSVKLVSYKLDAVAEEFLKENKVDLSPKELFANYKRGTSRDIQEIAIYCVKDCELVNRLINKRSIISNNVGMANVCVVPFSYLFTRGQGIKIFSLVAKICREESFIVKDLTEDDIDKSSYEGAIVFDPRPDVYFDPIVVMDYNSLYPSSMIAENISHDSIVGYKEYRKKTVSVAAATAADFFRGTGAGLGGAGGGEGTAVEESAEFELVKNTIREEYDNLAEYNYIDISYDLYEGKASEKKIIGYKTCRFAELKSGEKALLPRVLRKLLDARKFTRKRMEYVTAYLRSGETRIGIITNGEGKAVVGALDPTWDPNDYFVFVEDGESDEEYNVFHVEDGKYKIRRADIVRVEQTYGYDVIAVLEGLQMAYKVVCNSLYGQMGATTSPICYKELAACTTATGRRMVCHARDTTLSRFPGAKLTYGDSVTGDTPLLLRRRTDGGDEETPEEEREYEICLREISKLGIPDNMYEEVAGNWTSYEAFKPWEEGLFEKQQSSGHGYEAWTSHGWAKVRRVIRHKTQKKIYRVMTPTGCVDVTEDHSLLSPDLVELKPKEVSVGTELRHGFPEEYYGGSSDLDVSDDTVLTLAGWLGGGCLDLSGRRVPDEMLNLPRRQKELFWTAFYERASACGCECPKNQLVVHTKIGAQSIYTFLRSLGYWVTLEEERHGRVYRITFSREEKAETEAPHSICAIRELRQTQEGEFVYDLETEDGTFQAGVGQMIVKNTDSIFVNFVDYIKGQNPEKEFTEVELLEESIKVGEEAAKNVNRDVKKPQNIEYEKTFWPFTIFSKKRYFGNKYTKSIKKYKQTSMGIVLKRRDNAPILKTIYGGVIDIILNKRDMEGAKLFYRSAVKNLLEGNVDMSQLVISKSLRADYKAPMSVAHKVLADRMGDRDAGNKPQSNDRIPYCFIDKDNWKCKICKGKIQEKKCKCPVCKGIYCFQHLGNHKSVCRKICRFCHKDQRTLQMDYEEARKEGKEVVEEDVPLRKCGTCTAYYCGTCFVKHDTKYDSLTGEAVARGKCKKAIDPKLLQGDLIEHPTYIREERLVIDFMYYFERQIKEPVSQIFALKMRNPMSIVQDLINRYHRDKEMGENKKMGIQQITSFFQVQKKATSGGGAGGGTGESIQRLAPKATKATPSPEEEGEEPVAEIRVADTTKRDIEERLRETLLRPVQVRAEEEEGETTEGSVENALSGNMALELFEEIEEDKESAMEG